MPTLVYYVNISFLFAFHFAFYFGFDLIDQFVFFKHAHTCTLSYSDKDDKKNFFAEITSEDLCKHQWYIFETDIYCCLKEVY
jgi:hypothetical protein